MAVQRRRRRNPHREMAAKREDKIFIDDGRLHHPTLRQRSMNLFSKKPLEPLAPYADVSLYTAQGFAVLPVERYYAERGPSSPADPHSWEQPHGGAYAWGLPAPVDPDNWVVGIQAGVLPREGGRSLPK